MTGIVSYTGTGLYPPFVRDIINASWDLGNTKYSTMESKIAALTDDTTGWLGTVAAPHVTADTTIVPTIVEPSVTIPSEIAVTDILSTFTTTRDGIIAILSDKYAAFLTTNFPHDSADYEVLHTWLAAAVNSTSGLPANVQAQMLTDDKDRQIAEVSRASDALTQRFAAMGFPAPPGALQGGILQLQQKAQGEIAASSRRITIASVEQLKWAVEKMFSLRQLAITEAIEYAKMISSGSDVAANVMNVGYDIQTKLITAAAQYLGARSEVAKVKSQSDQFNVTTKLEAEMKNQAADMSILGDRVKALLTEIQALAQSTTALFNNIHASAGVSASDSVSTSV